MTASPRAVGASPRPRTRVAPPAASRPALRVVPRRYSRRVVVFAVAAAVFTFVTPVVFHVVLAQGQLQLDRLDREIGVARTEYEQRRLHTAVLASPERIIQEAQRLGMEMPADPPTYLTVPGAPAAPSDAGDTATTLGDWKKVKPELGDVP